MNSNLVDELPSSFTPLKWGHPIFEELSKRENTNWLQPLRAEGFFKYPPEPEYDAEKKQVSLSPWPASRYLSRIAASAPEQVMEIALEIPDTEEVGGVENIHV
jgi:hypothetical protein